MNPNAHITHTVTYVSGNTFFQKNRRNCVRRGPCSAKMPKKIQEVTDSELDSFARYRRRDIYVDGNIIKKMPYGTKKLGKGTGCQSIKITNKW